MKQVSFRLLLLVMLLVGATGGQSRAAIRSYALTVSPFAGAYVFEGNQRLDDRPVYGLAVGYSFSKNWTAEAVASYVDTRPEDGADVDVDVYQGRLDLLYHFRPEQRFVPYLAAGVGAVITDVDGGNGIGHDSDEDGLLDYGLGFKYFFTENVALRADVRHIFDYNLKDEIEGDAFNNFAATVGIAMQFGGYAPAPAVVSMPKDTDGDGVVDQFDRCPDTRLGVPVDGYGCPADSDRDGIPDFLDKCPGTAAGVAVDANGCPQEVKAPAPVDSDADGVEDGLDKCPDTPSGVAVNTYGCPADNDGDGIFDFEDRCPGTVAGTAVDATGCPPPAPKVTTPASMTLELQFATGEAGIRPEFTKDLQAAVAFIKAHPSGRILVEGHTDSVGSVESNLALSKARAAEVRRTLVERFDLDADRITAEGFGESRPVADNATPDGRQRNRRVVITVQPEH